MYVYIGVKHRPEDLETVWRLLVVMEKNFSTFPVSSTLKHSVKHMEAFKFLIFHIKWEEAVRIWCAYHGVVSDKLEQQNGLKWRVAINDGRENEWTSVYTWEWRFSFWRFDERFTIRCAFAVTVRSVACASNVCGSEQRLITFISGLNASRKNEVLIKVKHKLLTKLGIDGIFHAMRAERNRVETMREKAKTGDRLRILHESHFQACLINIFCCLPRAFISFMKI